MHRRVRLAPLAVLALLACGPSRDEQAPPRPVPAHVTAEQFATLSWLEGHWRGSDPSGTPFYESYSSGGAGRLRSFAYPDSSFGAPSDSGMLELRGDTLFSGSSAMQWVATHMDTAEVRFAPWRGASNAFVWRRTGDGAWTATLQWDSAGVAMSRMYQMRAVP